MRLRGKGYFIWQIPKCESGSAKTIALKARQAGLTHVLIKIADGSDWPYNVDRARGIDLVPPVLTALKSAGIQVWGWHYVRGDNPLGEARLGAQRARSLGIDGYVIDAEREYKRADRKAAAQIYAKELRRQLQDIPIALSSYRYPRVHYELPYGIFLAICDYAMPQVYFEQSHDPDVQLKVCLDQYMNLPNARPVIPTFPTYSTGKWRPTVNDLQQALATAKSLGLEGANAWSWDYAGRSGYQDLWQAFAEFGWDSPAEPPPDVPEELISRMNKRDISAIAGLYRKNAAHVTGDRTVVGVDAIGEWYRHLLMELLPAAGFEMTGKMGAGPFRQFTWVAKPAAGQVVLGSDTLGILDGLIQYHYTHFRAVE